MLSKCASRPWNAFLCAMVTGRALPLLNGSRAVQIPLMVSDIVGGH
jgi:hypothetical protein